MLRGGPAHPSVQCERGKGASSGSHSLRSQRAGRGRLQWPRGVYTALPGVALRPSASPRVPGPRGAGNGRRQNWVLSLEGGAGPECGRGLPSRLPGPRPPVGELEGAAPQEMRAAWVTVPVSSILSSWSLATGRVSWSLRHRPGGRGFWGTQGWPREAWAASVRTAAGVPGGQQRCAGPRPGRASAGTSESEPGTARWLVFVRDVTASTRDREPQWGRWRGAGRAVLQPRPPGPAELSSTLDQRTQVQWGARCGQRGGAPAPSGAPSPLLTQTPGCQSRQGLGAFCQHQGPRAAPKLSACSLESVLGEQRNCLAGLWLQKPLKTILTCVSRSGAALMSVCEEQG